VSVDHLKARSPHPAERTEGRGRTVRRWAGDGRHRVTVAVRGLRRPRRSRRVLGVAARRRGQRGDGRRRRPPRGERPASARHGCARPGRLRSGAVGRRRAAQVLPAGRRGPVRPAVGGPGRGRRPDGGPPRAAARRRRRRPRPAGPGRRSLGAGRRRRVLVPPPAPRAAPGSEADKVAAFQRLGRADGGRPAGGTGRRVGCVHGGIHGDRPAGSPRARPGRSGGGGGERATPLGEQAGAPDAERCVGSGLGPDARRASGVGPGLGHASDGAERRDPGP
jgi:hypothetical protein